MIGSRSSPKCTKSRNALLIIYSREKNSWAQNYGTENTTVHDRSLMQPEFYLYFEIIVLINRVIVTIILFICLVDLLKFKWLNSKLNVLFKLWKQASALPFVPWCIYLNDSGRDITVFLSTCDWPRNVSYSPFIFWNVKKLTFNHLYILNN